MLRIGVAAGFILHACGLALAQDGVVILGALGNNGYNPAIIRPEPSYLQEGTGKFNHHQIAFTSDLPPGSLLIRTGERKLYFIMPEGQAMVYAIGVGRAGFTWSGRDYVSRKAEWPDWRPPKAMVRREAERNNFIPVYVKGGPDNPLGARALYIGSTEYRVHGTNQPGSIGRAVSSGCIRMMNEEIIDLYKRVEVGAQVVVE